MKCILNLAARWRLAQVLLVPCTRYHKHRSCPEQQERRSEAPGTIQVPRPGVAVPLQGALYRCRLMDEDPIRETDKQVPACTYQRAAVYLNRSIATRAASNTATSQARRGACLLLDPDKSQQQVPWLTAAEPAKGKEEEMEGKSHERVPW